MRSQETVDDAARVPLRGTPFVTDAVIAEPAFRPVANPIPVVSEPASCEVAAVTHARKMSEWRFAATLLVSATCVESGRALSSVALRNDAVKSCADRVTLRVSETLAAELSARLVASEEPLVVALSSFEFA